MDSKKLLAIFVLSIFVVSLLAIGATAHKPDISKHVKERLNKVKDKLKDRVSDVTKLEGLKEHQLKILEGFETRMKERLDRMDKDKLQKLAKLPPGLAKKVLNETNFEKKLDDFTFREVGKADLKMAFHMRQIATDKMQASGKRLMEAQKRFEKTRDNFKSKKADFLKSKNLTDAKAYLTNVLDSLIEQVNKLKERVQSSEDLNEEKVADLLADLNSRLAKLNEWKTKVEAATAGAELKTILGEIRTSLKSENSILKALTVHGWRVALQHFAGVLKQADHLDSKLNRLLTFAENNNATVADKEFKVTEFQSKLAEAKKHFQLVVDEFKELRNFNQSGLNAPNIDIMSNEQARRVHHNSIKTHIKEAKANLKEARTILQALVKEIIPQLKDAKTDEGEPVQITEEDVLDPKKVTDGVDVEEGENVTLALEAEVEL